eukprot:TRINITY_DN822_c0_g1_i4.p1 TRINITY_DN822_c0_g1~~TRINITY_DN822_c0_g1_i4.p1  ORF type:complete len:791 (-),score=245.30 TRINITY_DN822_c0_g1_i4:277-2649(-)
MKQRLAVIAALAATGHAAAENQNGAQNAKSSGDNVEGIKIVRAVYAGNCGSGSEQTTSIAEKCEEKMSCAMMLDSEKLGDPAWGCAKDYSVTYKCGEFGDKLTKTISAEAAGQTITLSCQKVKAAKMVVKLITKVQKKSADDAEKEALTYEKYEHWCKKTQKGLNKAVKKEKDSIAELDLSVDGKSSESLQLKRSIAQLEKEIKDLEETGAEAAKEEAARVELYEKSKADFVATVDAVGTALDAVVKSMPGASLAQLTQLPLVMMSISESEQDMLLSMKDSPLTGAPAKREYDFKSGNVVNLLKNMQQKFKDQMLTADSEHKKAVLEFEGSKGKRDMTIKFSTEAKEKKAGIKATVDSELAAAEGQLKDLKEDLKADSSALEETDVQCKTKASEYKERSWMRQQELDAMSYAITKLQTGLTSLVQTPQKSAELLQKREQVARDWAKQWDVQPKAPAESAFSHFTKLLREQSHSQVVPVSKKIDISIDKQKWKIREDQQADDKKMADCNRQMDLSKNTLEDRTEQLTKLNNEKTVAEDEVKALSKVIDDNTEKLATEFQKLHEAQMVRQESKTENAMTIEDYEASREAIKTATDEIEDFYKDAKVANSFIEINSQKKAKDPSDVADAPDSFSGGFTGTKGAKSAVLGVLENLDAEFAKMIVSTKAMEEADQLNFDKTFKAQRVEKARLETEKDLKTQEANRLTSKVLEKREAIKLLDREKASVEQFLKDLEAECLSGPHTAEERKAMRTKEIKELEAAKKAIKDAMPANVALPAILGLHQTSAFLAPVNGH